MVLANDHFCLFVAQAVNKNNVVTYLFIQLLYIIGGETHSNKLFAQNTNKRIASRLPAYFCEILKYQAQ